MRRLGLFFIGFGAAMMAIAVATGNSQLVLGGALVLCGGTILGTLS